MQSSVLNPGFLAKFISQNEHESPSFSIYAKASAQSNGLTCTILPPRGLARHATILSALLFCCFCFLSPATAGADQARIDEFDKWGRELFARVDLSHPNLAEVKSLVDRDNYPAALELYKDIYVDYLAKLDLGQFGRWGAHRTCPDQLMEGVLTFAEPSFRPRVQTHKIGQPGNINWMILGDGPTNTWMERTSRMTWAHVLVNAFIRTGNAAYLEQWAAIWDDFDTRFHDQHRAARSRRDEYGGFGWITSILTRAWHTNARFRGLNRAARHSPETARQVFCAARLARFLIAADRTMEGISTQIQPGTTLTPNQVYQGASAMTAGGIAVVGFFNGEERLSQAVEAVSALVFEGNFLADGTDMEQAFQYHNAMVGSINSFLELREKHGEVFPDMPQYEKLIEARDYRKIFTDFRRPSPERDFAATSVRFPFGGYSIMRDDWSPDRHFVFFRTTRPGRGHRLYRDNNSFVLNALGQSMLVLSGDVGGVTWYYRSGVDRRSYFYHTRSVNSIMVDSQRQTPGRLPADVHFYTEPIRSRWHTSDFFDYTEGIFGQNSPIQNESYGDGKVSDVTHERQIMFLRQAGIWLVTDIVSSDEKRLFTQCWNFSPVYGEDDVVIDKEARRIFARHEERPGLQLYQFGSPSLEYSKYYGHAGDVDNGWVSFDDPAVDVQVEWKGQDSQQIVSVLHPTRQVSEPLDIAELMPGDGLSGFRLTLEDGSLVTYLRALDRNGVLTSGRIEIEGEALMTVADGDLVRGLVLGCTSLKIDGSDVPIQSADFEFGLDGDDLEGFSMTMPEGFRWVETVDGLLPDYGKNPRP